MGRSAVLRQYSRSSTADAVPELATLAQRAIDRHGKEAAHLLRGSEHRSFAVLAGEVSGGRPISAELKQFITEHFDVLTRRADEHWGEEEQHSGMLAGIYQYSLNGAVKAFRTHADHQGP
jgi:hypothetical protein